MRDVRLEMYVFRRIFLQDTHFNVEIAKYNSNDKYFIRRYREMLHTTLLAAVAQHGMHRYVIVDNIRNKCKIRRLEDSLVFLFLVHKFSSPLLWLSSIIFQITLSHVSLGLPVCKSALNERTFEKSKYLLNQREYIR